MKTLDNIKNMKTTYKIIIGAVVVVILGVALINTFRNVQAEKFEYITNGLNKKDSISDKASFGDAKNSDGNAVGGAVQLGSSEQIVNTVADTATLKGKASLQANSQSPENTAFTVSQKLIVNASIQMECLNYDESVNNVQKYTIDNKGYVSNSNIQGNSIRSSGMETQRNAQLTLRIPKGTHVAFISGLSKFGQITLQNIGTEDITNAYFDTDARVKSFKVQETRLLELYKKADKIADIITIEDKLRDVRQQIESLTGQIKLWDNLIDYTTINITLSEVKRFSDVVSTKESLFSRIKLNVKSAILAIKGMTEFGILVVAYLVPFVLVLFVVILVAWPIRRYVKSRRRASGQGDAGQGDEDLSEEDKEC